MAVDPTPMPLPEEALDYIRGFGLDPSLIKADGWDSRGYLALKHPNGKDFFATEWPEGFGYLKFIDLINAGVRRQNAFPNAVRAETSAITQMLISKNEAYGNSALDPVRIFSDASPEEQLLVRIDDKLSRLQRGSEYADEDTITDLIGYLILLKIVRK